MHPQRELDLLAARKRGLQMRIAERRAACVREIGELVRPLATVDRVVGTWRRVAPVASVAALPASIAFTQFVLPRLHGARKLLRWAPVALKAARVVSGFLRK